MKVYEVVFDKNSDKGVYAMSCVENPAMEDVWVTLAEHHKEIQFAAVDEEKKLLLGAALIPNKRIYRNMGGEEFYITFSKETIEEVAHAFIQNGYQNNSSENHEVKLEGVSVVESWTVADPLKDKSNVYGKEYEEGTMVVMMKVENDEAWQKAKDGQLNGFSIDGLFQLKELNLKSDKMADTKSIIDAIKEGFEAVFKKEEVKMGKLKLKDGKTTIEFEGDAPEVGMPVFVLSESKERITAPEGKHELEGGEFLHVDKNGLVAEGVEEDKKEEMVEMAKMFAEKLSEFETKYDAKLAKIESDHKAAIDAEKEKNKELEAKLEKTPAAEKIVLGEQKIEEPKTAKERLYNALMSAKN